MYGVQLFLGGGPGVHNVGSSDMQPWKLLVRCGEVDADFPLLLPIMYYQ
jgi:hypothetical protein